MAVRQLAVNEMKGKFTGGKANNDWWYSWGREGHAGL